MYENSRGIVSKSIAGRTPVLPEMLPSHRLFNPALLVAKLTPGYCLRAFGAGRASLPMILSFETAPPILREVHDSS